MSIENAEAVAYRDGPIYRENDPQADVYFTVPYSDIYNWGIRRDNFHLEVEKAFRVHYRLNRIRQLGALRVVPPDKRSAEYIELPHSRYDHSGQVSLIAEQIALRNGMNEQFRKLLAVGTWAHDLASNAGGDSIKYLDPDFMDEETQVAEVIPQSGWDLMRKHNIAYRDVYAAINNQGLAGKMLDVGDKDAYTCLDLKMVSFDRFQLLMQKPLMFYNMTQVRGVNRSNDILEMMEQHPDIGNIYQDMRVGPNETLYSVNPRRLLSFGAVRAIMHNQVYQNPVNQGRDHLMRRLARPLYARDGSKVFSPRTLRQMVDHQFLDILARAYGFAETDTDAEPGNRLYFELSQWRPEYERFETEAEAEAFADEVVKDPETVFIGSGKAGGFKPGTDFPVLDREDGQVKPLKEAEPVASAQLEAMERSSRGFDVYYSNTGVKGMVGVLLRRLAEDPRGISVG